MDITFNKIPETNEPQLLGSDFFQYGTFMYKQLEPHQAIYLVEMHTLIYQVVLALDVVDTSFMAFVVFDTPP